MKRYLAVLLSVLMVLGTVVLPAAVFAQDVPLEQETLPARKDLLKFDANLIAKWPGFGVKNYQEEDGTEVTAARIAHGTNQGMQYPYGGREFVFSENGIDTDMSDYRTINFRMYSEVATNEVMNILLWKGPHDFRLGYMLYEVKFDWVGWKTISINFGDLAPTRAEDVSEQKIETFVFNFGGWNAGGTHHNDTAFGLSEVWLSNPYNEVKLDDSIMIWEFNSEEKIDVANQVSGGTPGWEADTAVTNMHDVSAKFAISGTDEITAYTPARHLIIDSGQYKYLNLLVHSNQKAASGAGIDVTAWCYGTFKFVDDATKKCDAQVNIPIDWTGWKVVSIPLSDFNGRNMWREFKYLQIQSGGAGLQAPAAGTELNFDMVWFSKNVPVTDLALTATTASAGADEMPLENGAVSFQFNTPLRKIDETRLTITKEGETAGQAVTCTAKGDTMTLTNANALEYETSYTMTIPAGAVTNIFGQTNKEAAAFRFKTLPQGLNSFMPTLTDGAGNPLTEMPESGETIKSTMKVSNGLPQPKNATLIITCYDAGNRMISCNIVNKTIAANAIDTLTLETTAAGVMAKAFGVSDFFSLQPLNNGFAQVPPSASNGGSQGGGEQEPALHLNAVSVKEDQLFLGGKVDGALPRMVILAVRGKSAEEPMFLTPVMAENDGTFSVETNMPYTAVSGAYEVFAAACRIAEEKRETVHFLSQVKRNALLSAINAAEKQEEVTKLLTENRLPLGLPEDGTVFTHICTTVFEQRPYDTYALLTAMPKDAQTVLAELNASTWAGYPELLNKHPMILGSSSDGKFYRGLNAENKAFICRETTVSAPFESFAAFRTAFARAIAEYQKNGNKTNHTGGGGGGSGGGKKGSASSNLVTVPNAIGQNSGSETLQPVAPVTPVKPAERFADLTAAEWARESVERLFAAGAISEAEQFRPNDSITREEFVKLLVESFKLAKSETAPAFTDVAADVWYAPYIAAVQSAGIVAGYEDGRFGVGEQITRQDMAVMLSRTMELLDAGLTAETAEPFTDDGQISSYARNAVYAMQQAGIINGLGGGMFGPMQNASRAQAAKLLCGLLDLLAK